MLYFGTTKSKQKSRGFFCEYYYKIAKNRPMEIKLTVLNRQDYAIFKTPQYFKFGSILREVGPQGNFGSIFGRLKFYVVSIFL